MPAMQHFHNHALALTCFTAAAVSQGHKALPVPVKAHIAAAKDGQAAGNALRHHVALRNPAPTPDALPVTEIEWNGDLAAAVDLASGPLASGNNGTPGDIDVYRWTLASPAFVSGTVVAGQTGPIVDSTLTLLAADGSDVAFNDDFAGLLSQIGPLYLPAGTYYWSVDSFQGGLGGAYDLMLQTTPANVLPCGVSPTPGTTGTDTWTVTLPQDGVLDVAIVANNANADLAIAVLRPDGTLAFFNDDRNLLNPGVHIGLPAGSYEFEVFDIVAGAAEGYSISCAITAGLPDIGAAGAATGALLGDQQADLFRLALAGDQGITFATGDDPASATNVGDTIVALYDRNFRLVLEVDDTFATGFYSGQSLSLPQGQYYLQVRGFPGSTGAYQLTASTGQPFLQAGVLVPGIPTTVATIAGIAATYRFDVASDAAHAARMSNDYFGILRANGEAVVGNAERSDLLSPQVRHLGHGAHYVVVYDRFATTGNRTLTVGSTDLEVDAMGDFVGHSREQNLVVLVDEIQLTTPWIVLPQVSGRLALYSPVSVGWQVTPASGTHVWFHPRPVIPQSFGFDLYFQQVEFGGANANFPPGIVARIGGLGALR